MQPEHFERDPGKKCGDPNRVETTHSILPQVYRELRVLAESHIRHERAGITLSATDLVHDVFLRLDTGSHLQRWESKAQFFKAAAIAMQRILVEHARKRKRLKHGGGRMRINIDSCVQLPSEFAEEQATQLLDLDAALREFAEVHPKPAEVVRLRYFAGLSVDETARVMSVSTRTAQRAWAFAKAWLYDRMYG